MKNPLMLSSFAEMQARTFGARYAAIHAQEEAARAFELAWIYLRNEDRHTQFRAIYWQEQAARAARDARLLMGIDE